VSLRVPGKPNYFSMKRPSETGEAVNREEFFSSLGFDPSSVVRGEQVHGDNIAMVENPGIHPATDALVTNKRGLLLGISVADCVPVLLVDKSTQTIAAVHAGWRGTAQRIAAKTVEYFMNKNHSHPENILAFIGPSAGVCCYEVGKEVAGNFSMEYCVDADENGKCKLDLKRVNFTQLIESGVPANNIEVSEACTICDENFHSFRRDGTTSGRMLAVIGMKQ
jgi:YfiH family protein